MNCGAGVTLSVTLFRNTGSERYLSQFQPLQAEWYPLAMKRSTEVALL